MFLAIILYLVIIFSFLQNWSLLTVPAVLFFSFKYNPVSLIPLAVLFDGYFGNFYTFPTLSALAILWFGLVEYTRPRFAQLTVNKYV